MSAGTLDAAGKRRLAVLLLAGLAARAAFCWRFPLWGPGGTIPNISGYEGMAESLIRSATLIGPAGDVTATREPGYPFLLAGLYLFTGPSYRAAQALHCLLGAATLLFIFLIGDRVFGRRTAWLATAIAAFYPQFLYYTSSLERETFQLLLTTFFMWLLLRVSRAPSVKAYAAAGAAMAVCPLTNSALLPICLALAAACCVLGRRRGEDHRRGVAVFLAAMFAVYSVWPLRNYLAFHRFILGINGGGGHLYTGIIIPNDVAGTPKEIEIADHDPVCIVAQRLPINEQDPVYYRGAFRFMREHPLGYVRICLASFVKLWRLYPYQRSYSLNYRMVKWVGLLSDGWIIPLGFLGMLLAGRRFPEADLFYAFIFSLSFLYMLFWAVIRYRLPAMPYVILFCAYALMRAAERLWAFGTARKS